MPLKCRLHSLYTLTHTLWPLFQCSFVEAMKKYTVRLFCTLHETKYGIVCYAFCFYLLIPMQYFDQSLLSVGASTPHRKKRFFFKHSGLMFRRIQQVEQVCQQFILQFRMLSSQPRTFVLETPSKLAFHVQAAEQGLSGYLYSLAFKFFLLVDPDNRRPKFTRQQ